VRVSLVGGMDRLGPHYRVEAKKQGFELRVFKGLETNMAAKLMSSGAVVLFTGMISHEARNQVVAAARAYDIPLLQCHSCGISSFRDCLSCISKGEGALASAPAGKGLRV
jgi:hypothetical protein